jgi:uroporphyrinogen decarboxylase
METQNELTPLNEEEAEFVDPWGTVFTSGPGYTHPSGPPLVGIDTIEGLRDYPWPKPEQFGDITGMRAEAERLYHQTDYAIALRRPGIRGGLLDKGGDLRGMEQFMMDLALEPDYCRALMEILAEIYVGVYTRALNEVGPYVQIVETQDDLGAQLQPLISPRTWRDIIKPSQKVIFDAIHQAAPRAKIIFHTDGNVYALIPDLIECGVDVLNPIQPSAAPWTCRPCSTATRRLCARTCAPASAPWGRAAASSWRRATTSNTTSRPRTSSPCTTKPASSGFTLCPRR